MPTLVIGFWPRVAIDLYEASTNALASRAGQARAIALGRLAALG